MAFAKFRKLLYKMRNYTHVRSGSAMRSSSSHRFSPDISGNSRLNPGLKRPPQKKKGDSHAKLKVVCVTARAAVKDHRFDKNRESILV
jgi:hypothetical protein